MSGPLYFRDVFARALHPGQPDLEFITPAETDIAITLDKLEAIHRYAYSKLGDELLWSQSMPCQLPGEDEIEIAWYGNSNLGTLKHVYHRGRGDELQQGFSVVGLEWKTIKRA